MKMPLEPRYVPEPRTYKPNKRDIASWIDTLTRRAQHAARAGNHEAAHRALLAISAATRRKNPAIAAAWLAEAEQELGS